MAGDFGPVLQKLGWSHHHLTRLQEAITEYIDLKPYVAIIEDQPKCDGYSATFKLRIAPPPRIALIAGDALNSMQGALDYLAWQLALASPAVPGRPTSFPIRIPEDDGSLPVPQILDAKGADAIRDQRILDALDAVQPYKDGHEARSHPLFVLARLNRETKHRHLPLLVVSVPAFAMSQETFGVPDRIPIPPALGDEGSEDCSFIRYSETHDGRAPKEIEISPLVALEKVGQSPEVDWSPLWDSLVTIFNRITEDVVPRFRPFF